MEISYHLTWYHIRKKLYLYQYRWEKNTITFSCNKILFT